MTMSRREAAFSAFFACLQEVPGVNRVARIPNFRLEDIHDQPALIQVDGREAAQRTEATGIIHLLTGVSVLVCVRADNQDEIGPALDALHAGVRAAVGAQPTLGNAVSAVYYDSCDEPLTDPAEGSPPNAVLHLKFVLDRWERELDPYTPAP